MRTATSRENGVIDPSASFWRGAVAVAVKDWRCEWRGRAALSAVGLFSIAAPATLGFVLARQRLDAQALGGLLWLVLFFAALVGLPRAFVREEESGTAALLRLHFRSDSVLWGKAAAQFALLAITQLAAVPLFLVMLNASITRPLELGLVLVLGDLGLAVLGALLGAIAASARSKGALFSAVAVPIALPLLIAASTATAACFGAGVDLRAALSILIFYDLALVAAAWMLFDFVWGTS